ncbi:MAG: esterase/lipase family protein [Pseudomonadales bacterium]
MHKCALTFFALLSVLLHGLPTVAAPLASNTSAKSECVVLLHGLARTEKAMRPLADALTANGYTAVNLGYPSTKASIEQLAEPAVKKALAECPSGRTIHFVSHSMGGIILRQYLSQHSIADMGRVVMLAPPNKGSEVVDSLHKMPGYYWLNGPAGLQLGTGANSVPLRLGPAHFNLGIIAGTSTFNPILSLMLPNPDDGKVSVANTKLEGMNDHISMPVTHTFMMSNDDVIEQVLYYLKNGRFVKP